MKSAQCIDRRSPEPPKENSLVTECYHVIYSQIISSTNKYIMEAPASPAYIPEEEEVELLEATGSEMQPVNLVVE